MKKSLIIVLLIPLFSWSQIADNFNDGDLINNPQWFGEVNEFKVNSNHQLQLDASGTDTSVIYIPTIIDGSCEWRLWVKLSFSPSDNNYLKIFLQSDSEDMKIPLNGYYLRIGRNGSDDRIEIYRQEGSNHTKMLEGQNAIVSSTTNILGLKIIRDTSWNWEVFSDYGNTGIYTLEGSFYDNSFPSGSYFGISCRYTTSNSTKFYFDDIYYGDIIIDSIPPSVVSHSIDEEGIMNIKFSETLDPTTSLNTENFTLQINNTNPSSVSLSAQDELLVNFDHEFINQNDYYVSIEGIMDLSENEMPDTLLQFSYFVPFKNCLAINEIMADPYPPVDLPETEYIELLNKTDRNINLHDFSLIVGSSEKQFPEKIFPANSYAIICNRTDTDLFTNAVNLYGISSFPALTNNGQTVSIVYKDSITIDEAEYSASWYKDPAKEDGGWSLERIDPENNCSRRDNWRASVDPSGGTPGFINSVFAENMDFSPPYIKRLNVKDSISVYLSFSEEMDFDTIPDPESFHLEDNINPVEITIVSSNEIYLYFELSFVEKENYSVQIHDLYDLCGNLLNDTLIHFSYYNPVFGDIIINEVMYDPEPGIELPLSDYIEILNRSAYLINLEGMQVIIDDKIITFPAMEISAGEFLIICPDNETLSFGSFIKTCGILGSNDLTNSGKILSINDKYDNIISSIKYDPLWHENDYKAEGGWSLERIDPDNICEGKNNWTSSLSDNGGTPGQINSVKAFNPDEISPLAIRAFPKTSNSIEIIFSESIDLQQLQNSANYITSENLNNPLAAYSTNLLMTRVELFYDDHLSEDIVYDLTINNIWDCAENNIENDNIKIGICDTIKASDIVINEILFNPVNDGVDYVELYNRSEKILDLSELMLSKKNEKTNVLESIKEISDETYLLFPDNYIVLCSSSVNVKENFYHNNSMAFIYPDIQIPSLANTSGRIVLINRSFVTIDDLSYSEEMHFPLLNSYDGVSLERINPDRSTNDKNNWHSAAETVGFGTPGLRNSQYSEIIDKNVKVNIIPKIFSPDSDGYNDILSINCKFDEPGNIGSVVIYNSDGFKVKNIIFNTLFSVDEIFSWDGTDEAGERCSIGIYIVYVEYVNPSGSFDKIKKTCVLARKLDN